jgi:hypothetical protein
MTMTHNEVIIHDSLPDIFTNTTLADVPDTKVWFSVRCTRIFQGKPCNARLFDVNLKIWEGIKGNLSIKCRHCEEVEDFSLWE